jgi:purine-binding chemotaxis protein CheW
VGVEKQYVHHLDRTQNCQIGVFLAYGAGEHSALVDAALYMPRSWIDSAPRRAKAGVPERLTYQPRSALGVSLLRQVREAGHLPGTWVTTWHGEGFEADLRARLDADGWRYLIPVSLHATMFASPDASDASPVREILAARAGGEPAILRAWEPADDGARHGCWLVGCTDVLTGAPLAFVSNAPEDDALETIERIVATRWHTVRMLAERCTGVSLDVYRVRGWDGWHRHVALALLASAFRACLPAGTRTAPTAEAAPAAPASAADLPAFDGPEVLQPADAVSTVEPAVAIGSEPDVEPTPSTEPCTITYRLVVELLESDWRAVRAFQTWLVADEAGAVLSSSPSREEIERQEVGADMEVLFESACTPERILAALDEVPEIVVAELIAQDGVAEADEGEATVELGDADELLASLEAELSARTAAREAGLMPAFEGPAEVIGNTMDEIGTQELVAAQAANAANGHSNGHGNGNGNGATAPGSLSASVAPPLPPVEAPVRQSGAARPSTAPAQPSSAADGAGQNPQASSKKTAEEKARPAEEQMVVLDVGDEAYGIPVQRVREIIRVPPITRVPNGPAFLEGVVNLRGQVIPVMDLRKHLGIPAGDETRRSRVVVSELGRHTVGLIVDGVSQVVMVATTEIEPPPSLIAGVNDGQVCGVARLGDKLVLFLDPDWMLPNG